MRLVLTQDPVKLVLRWTRRLLFATAALALGYCAFVMVDSGMFQHRERHQLESQLRVTAVSASVTLNTNGLIGRIEIPRLGLSTMVMEGTTEATLRRAVGHIAGTGLPGHRGNAGIAGHRDTFFLPLRNIRREDLITVTTLLGEYRYRVVSIKVVNPENVAVLDSDGSEVLTLVTCYPFYFVGSAQERFIVRAERVT
jgi:sortase A